MNYGPQSDQTKAHFEREFRESLNRSSRVSEQLNRSLANSLIIEGFMGECDAQRYTAAGLPVVKFQLRHMSQQSRVNNTRADESSQRQVVCDLSVLLIGEKLCSKAQKLAVNTLVKVEGFLTRNAYKQELSWVILEALSLDVLYHQGHPSEKDDALVR